MDVIVSVKDCDTCPYAKVSRVYTPDSFENVRKIHCIQLNKDVHSYLDWNDNSPIPNDCPFK